MNERILVVDDEESIRFTFNAFLSDAGYSVETAETLDTALQQLETHSFDAIFLDILLGRESGIKVLQASREAHAQAMAAAEIEQEADLSGSTLLSPAECKFAMATGVDPHGAYTDEREEDH